MQISVHESAKGFDAINEVVSLIMLRCINKSDNRPHLNAFVTYIFQRYPLSDTRIVKILTITSKTEMK